MNHISSMICKVNDLRIWVKDPRMFKKNPQDNAIVNMFTEISVIASKQIQISECISFTIFCFLVLLLHKFNSKFQSNKFGWLYY